MNMRFRKKLLLLGLEMGRFFRPRWLQVKLNPFLLSLDLTFKEMIKLESDPIMKRRWLLLKNIVLWILSRDGAYRWRAEKFYSLFCSYYYGLKLEEVKHGKTRVWL